MTSSEVRSMYMASQLVRENGMSGSLAMWFVLALSMVALSVYIADYCRMRRKIQQRKTAKAERERVKRQEHA
jgi:cyanate permease